MSDNNLLTKNTQPEQTPVIDNNIPLNMQSYHPSNLILGILGGTVAMLICAVLWALLSNATGKTYALAAIGVGLLVGVSVRLLGRGRTIQFGIVGAVLSLLGCVLGNAFTIYLVYASELNVSVFTAFNEVGIGNTIDIITSDLGFMSLIFYAIAAYEGFKFSIRG